uniref:Ig-like domain-containing protein n=1 Tax=Monopterus albus TaxID=43700 RepID=A0A3Q3QG76_MONAL
DPAIRLLLNSLRFCELPGEVNYIPLYSNTRVKWYKQSIGDTLTLITTLMKAIANPTYEQGFPPSRFDVNDTTAFTTLTIKKTMQEDQAVYHCAVSTWSEDQWSGTYLFFKGDTYLYFPSDPVRPGDLVTLQCSVLFDNKTCLQEHSVYWFRTRSDDSHPSVIYAHLNSGDHCERSPEISSSQKCVYNLSRNVSSSDAGTYYCAVATCGEILFGSGTKLEIEGICILFNFFFYPYSLAKVIKYFDLYFSSHLICNTFSQTGEDMRVYSAVVFTMLKTGSAGMRNPNVTDRERIYAAVKAFGLD